MYAAAREIGRMLEEKGIGGMEEEFEQEKRSSFARGVSVEAEYCFTNAVGRFTKEALKEGSYKGNIVGNVKEQLAARARVEEKGNGRKTVVLIGGSQIQRIAGEMERVGGEVVEVQKMIRIAGDWTSEKVEKVKEELLLEDGVPDRIVIGGPSNSTTRHGVRRRGFGPERRMLYKEGGKGGKLFMQDYHMTEPIKISMLERGRLVKLVEDLVKFCEENFPTSTVLYVEMYPRFVERCCEKISHMTKDDPWVLDNSRREIERELRVRIEGSCEIVGWYEAAGLDIRQRTRAAAN